MILHKSITCGGELDKVVAGIMSHGSRHNLTSTVASLFLVPIKIIASSIYQMDESVRLTSEQLEAELHSLPPSWPQQLVFVNPPTLASPPYALPINPLQPNEGHFRLDEGSPANQHFLRLQTWLATKIDYYQVSSAESARSITKELRHVAQGLEELKRTHWDALRRVHTPGMYIHEQFHLQLI